MENYKNVTVEKLANIYFDGNVISRNITFQDGTKKNTRCYVARRVRVQHTIKRVNGNNFRRTRFKITK